MSNTTIQKGKVPKIVCIGGGTGQATILRGLKNYPSQLTAIVAVTDSGRSTGTLRRELEIPAPGDIRNCLVSLSESPELMKELFQYRFPNKGLEGMSMGNLLIAALTKVTGSFEQAVKETSKILSIKGKAISPIIGNTHICAELTDGNILEEEFNIRELNKAPIKRVFLKNKNIKTNKECIEEIKNTDLIIIGPGSLYTSVIVNLLVPKIRDAIKKSKAKKIYISNMMTQPGQTDNYDIVKHVTEIEKYLGKGILDFVMINDNKPSKELLAQYQEKNARYINHSKNCLEKIKSKGIKIIKKDLLDEKRQKQELWQKQDYLRHDPTKVAKVIFSILTPQMKAVILAAGEGTRMRPFSFSESKVMLNFLGKPLLAHHVDEFAKNGITDFVIIGNKNNIESIQKYFDQNYKDYTFEYAIQEKQLGPVNAISYAEKYLHGTYFIIAYGDSVASEDYIAGILKKFREQPNVEGVVTLRKVKDPREFGVAKFKITIKNNIINICF